MNIKSIKLELFIDVIRYLNNYLYYEKYKIIIKEFEEIESEYDKNIFFKAGQLLTMFYIFNIEGLDAENIKYKKGTFYIKNLFNINSFIDYEDNHCIAIAKNIIRQSVYSKEFLPSNITYISLTEIKDIEEGFINLYKIMIKEKSDLINIIRSHGELKIFTDIIKKINMLNYKDLHRQLEIIRYRFVHQYRNYAILKNENNKKQFEKKCLEVADKLIESSIIGIHNRDIEITWIGYIKNKIVPIEYKNIYIALFFTYLSERTDKSYYLASAIQAIRPVIRNFDFNYNNVNHKEFIIELNVFTILNKTIQDKVLSDFIENNYEVFTEYKKEINWLIPKDVLVDKVIKIINKIIL